MAGWPTRVRFPKTLWVSVLKIGADGGARFKLIWVSGQAMHHFVNTHIHGPTAAADLH